MAFDYRRALLSAHRDEEYVLPYPIYYSYESLDFDIRLKLMARALMCPEDISVMYVGSSMYYIKALPQCPPIKNPYVFKVPELPPWRIRNKIRTQTESFNKSTSLISVPPYWLYQQLAAACDSKSKVTTEPQKNIAAREPRLVHTIIQKVSRVKKCICNSNRVKYFIYETKIPGKIAKEMEVIKQTEFIDSDGVHTIELQLVENIDDLGKPKKHNCALDLKKLLSKPKGELPFRLKISESYKKEIEQYPYKIEREYPFYKREKEQAPYRKEKQQAPYKKEQAPYKKEKEQAFYKREKQQAPYKKEKEQAPYRQEQVYKFNMLQTHKLLVCLMKYSNCKTIADLKNRNITDFQWKKVAKRLNTSIFHTKKYWYYKLHMQLFCPEPIRMKDIITKFIVNLYQVKNHPLYWPPPILSRNFDGFTKEFLTKINDSLISFAKKKLGFNADNNTCINYLYNHHLDLVKRTKNHWMLPRLDYILRRKDPVPNTNKKRKTVDTFEVIRQYVDPHDLVLKP